MGFGIGAFRVKDGKWVFNVQRFVQPCPISTVGQIDVDVVEVMGLCSNFSWAADLG